MLNEDLNELHERGYSLYNNLRAKRLALKELHARKYQIFDEEGTKLLHQVYQEEFMDCRWRTGGRGAALLLRRRHSLQDEP